MKIDQIIQTLGPSKFPILKIKHKIDPNKLDFYGSWYKGICDKNQWKKNDNDGDVFYFTVCGYAHVIKDDEQYEILSANISYFKEANAYLTYSAFWTDTDSMSDLWNKISTKPVELYLGVSYIPVGFEKIVYKNSDKLISSF